MSLKILNKMFKLFRLPEEGEDVVIAADPADGGNDYCYAVAKSKKHADSFMNFHARMEAAQLGYELNKMGLFIRRKTGRFPMVGVERNTGGATIAVLQTLNYPSLYRMKTFDAVDKTESNRIGWVTNTQTRIKMLDDLALSLRQRVNRIYDIETIKELMAFIYNQRSGKPEAGPGSHDDRVIGEAIAWQLYQTAQAESPQSLAEKTKQFPTDLGLPSFSK